MASTPMAAARASAGLRGGYGVYAEAGTGAATSAVYEINRFQSTTGHVGVTGICTGAGGDGGVW